jgi:hypothetical protein
MARGAQATAIFALLAPFALWALSCARPPSAALNRAAARLKEGRPREALSVYDELATREAVPPRERVRALTGAARACDRLGDADGARARLERAVAIDLPGTTEVALFELAEHVRDRDPARALNLYYRAAAGAEKHLDGRFPYRAAMDRILQLSLSR